jgi:hypothetical protein
MQWRHLSLICDQTKSKILTYRKDYKVLENKLYYDFKLSLQFNHKKNLSHMHFNKWQHFSDKNIVLPKRSFIFQKKSIQFVLKCNALTCNASMYSKTSIICITWRTYNITIALSHYVIYIPKLRLARKYKFKTVYKNLMAKKLVHKHRNSLKKPTHYGKT